MRVDCKRCGSITQVATEKITDPLQICPVCNYAYFYIESNFSKPIGLFILLAAASIFISLHIINPSGWNVLVIAAAFIIDAIAYKISGFRTVCYNCLTEFINLKINPEHKEYNLIIAARFTNQNNNK
ncbi:MAG: hypothetical protein HY606_10870 [Planctomycetes bacterium]|nr:hypothetical protein [Planctomycetota bacterium]